MWTCPDCGDAWRVHPLTNVDPEPSYDFATAEHITPAEWLRVGSGERALTTRPSSMRTLEATYGSPEAPPTSPVRSVGSRESAVEKLIWAPVKG